VSESTSVIKPFDADQFNERIKDKIKAEFVNLLPDEAFTQMVKDTLNRFQHATSSKPYRHAQGVTRPSEFDGIVLEVFTDWIKNQMKLLLDFEEWQSRWGANSKIHASEALQKLLIDNSGEIIAGVLGTAMQLTMTDLRNRL